MAFRGFVSLNNRELVNSSRTVAHIGRSVPTLDYALLGSPTPNDCAMEQAVIGSELAYDPLIDIGANTPNNRIMTATGVPGFDYTFGFPFGDSYEFVTSPVVFENAHSIRLGGPGIASTGLQLIWDDDHGWIYPVTALDDTWVIKAWVMSPHTNTGNITLEAVIEALDIDGRQVFGSEDSYGGGPQTYPRTPGPDDPGWTEFDWFFDGPLPAGTVYVNIYLKVTFDDPGDYLYVGEYAANINWQDATGLYTVHETAELGDFYEPGLYRPGNGARRYDDGLYEYGDCWGPASLCGDCRTHVVYDDTWDGLQEFLDDNLYRVELAPWYSTQIPESGEFGGIWLMDVNGLDGTPVNRPITDTAGIGGVAGPNRAPAVTITFDALLIACTNAGVDYGLKWLTCMLRDTTDNIDTRLRYLAAHPGHSDVDPLTLWRDRYGVVLTKAPTIQSTHVGGAGENRQASMYRVSWEMVATHPYAYYPAVDIDVDWDYITRQPVNWIHAADCTRPETCEDMPVLFSTECVPEEIEVVTKPAPVCGGCMPVSAIDKYRFLVPTQEYAFRCKDTVVNLTITNTGSSALNLQAFWRVCGTDVRCEDNLWPLQISGLPASAELQLDGITGRYKAFYDNLWRRPVGIVGTPNGAPWRPPVIDRKTCYELIVQAAPDAQFTVDMSLVDREG